MGFQRLVCIHVSEVGSSADGRRFCLQVPVIIKVPMARFQGVAYNWIKATGTLRLDPDSLLNANTFRTYAPLNNKVMELRKVPSPPSGAFILSSVVGWLCSLPAAFPGLLCQNGLLIGLMIRRNSCEGHRLTLAKCGKHHGAP